MTTLAPMRAELFERFRSDTVRAYADDNVLALRWLEQGALERAHGEFERLLPEGIATPGHHLYEIVDGPERQTVGFIWFALTDDAPDSRMGYVYNIRVFEEQRGKGYARAAMALLEDRARELGALAIALHVFGLNSTAQALYRAGGYGITGFNMIKRLDHGA